MPQETVALKAYRAGRLLEVSRLLSRGVENPDDAALEVEVLYLRGDALSARTFAEKRLKSASSASLSVAQRARYHAILAACKADQGNLPDALAAIQQAMSFAEQAKDGALVALTAAVFLERSCDQAGFEASLPLASYTRRAAARCGDAQTLASVHLTFARLEGRCGRYQTALRHLAAGRELLKGDPNELTSAILDLDESGVLFLMEDAAGALETASRASIAAGQSGWSRGELVAKLNIAQCLVALDRLDEADDST